MSNNETEMSPNVKMIRVEGVRLISGRIPLEVRKELYEAVKLGQLGHLKKDKLKPEAFFHPNSIYKAKEKRGIAQNASLRAIAKVSLKMSEI